MLHLISGLSFEGADVVFIDFHPGTLLQVLGLLVTSPDTL